MLYTVSSWVSFVLISKLMSVQKKKKSCFYKITVAWVYLFHLANTDLPTEPTSI